MTIPENERHSHLEWIAGFKKISKNMCLVAPKNSCTRPELKRNFLKDEIPIF